MELTLSLVAADLDPGDLHELALDLRHSLVTEAGVEAELRAGSAPEATRGDLLSIGTLAVTFLSSGAAVALLNVFKAYFDRSSSVTVELERPDGAKLTVKAGDLRAGQLERTLSLAQDFLGARPS